jgi:dihydroorotate dehydrogenase
MSGLYSLMRPFVMRLDPEHAHRLAINAFATGLHPRQTKPDPSALGVNLWGFEFPNPVGMAAGFDKNGEVPDALLATGLGFVEVGTVTPLPQAGNPKPRVFRLGEDQGVINRLGFNNEGHARVAARLAARAGRGGIVGVNVGANMDSPDRHRDYTLGIENFAADASFLTVNISSPNTPGLRDLQARDELDRLLETVFTARARTVDNGIAWRPILLKIAPDISDDGLKDIAEISLARGIDGVIVSNSTVSRDSLKPGRHATEKGGLSGRPLFALSTKILAKFYLLTGGKMPLIGVGGVESGKTAYEKIRAGASLVQLYTAMIFEGPDLIAEIKRDLHKCLAEDGQDLISKAVGIAAKDWANRDITV